MTTKHVCTNVNHMMTMASLRSINVSLLSKFVRLGTCSSLSPVVLKSRISTAQCRNSSEVPYVAERPPVEGKV